MDYEHMSKYIKATEQKAMEMEVKVERMLESLETTIKVISTRLAK
jgi:hypothetical protein